MNRNFFAPIARFFGRYPFGAGCIILSLVLAGINVWMRLGLANLVARQHDVANEGKRMLNMIAHGSQLRSQLAEVRAATRRITDNLVVERNIPDNYGYFFTIEQNSHAKLTELQQRPAIVPVSGAPTSYKRVPFSLTFSGSFRSIIGTLQRLEYGPRLGRIDGFQIQRTDPKTGDVTIHIDFELLGYP